MNIAIIPKNNGEEEIVILEDNQEVLITRHYEGYKATYLSHRIVQSPSKEFLDWSAKSGYATSASDIQLALWDAWRAGQKRTRELLVVWETTLQNRENIVWSQADAIDAARLRKSIDELRAVIIPNVSRQESPGDTGTTGENK